LETATTYGLPVKVLVLNNYGDGMVRQWQKLFYDGRMSASDKSLRSKDFIRTAQADGFEYAVRLEERADVDRVVREWLEFDGPAFLEVIIDPDAGVYPMVGPGLAYDQMITGDFIPTRSRTSEEDVESSSMF
jgi:acetolactate synthase-1/2/3 large subunit